MWELKGTAIVELDERVRWYGRITPGELVQVPWTAVFDWQWNLKPEEEDVQR